MKCVYLSILTMEFKFEQNQSWGKTPFNGRERNWRRKSTKKDSVCIEYIFCLYSAGIWRRFMDMVGRACLSFLYQVLLNWDNVLCPLTFLSPYRILQNPSAIFPPISIKKIQPYVTLSTLCSSPVGRHCLSSEMCSSPACGWFTTAQCPCTDYLLINQVSAPLETGLNCS